jgi:hypothetical protein
MRPITDQVDEFIEGYFDGSIVSELEAIKQSRSLVKEARKLLMDDMQELIFDLVPKYLGMVDIEEEDKKTLAQKIFLQVLLLRHGALLKNNPDTLKEATYWKSRCLTTEEEGLRKDKQILSLKDDITKLRVGQGAIK